MKRDNGCVSDQGLGFICHLYLPDMVLPYDPDLVTLVSFSFFFLPVKHQWSCVFSVQLFTLHT